MMHMLKNHGLLGLRRWAMTGWVLGLLLLTGCATGPDAHPQDPLEPMNRQVSRFNEALDNAALKPVAEVYRDYTPDLMQTGVRNFFSNFRDFWSFVNATAQLRPQEATENFMRVTVNTLLGLGGLLDIATEMGIPRTTLDFGQTLGRWGVPAGPYVVLPLLGPSNGRDALGRGVQFGSDGLLEMDLEKLRNDLFLLEIVYQRASLLNASAMLDESAIDKYSFVRDFYLQRRQNQIDDLIDQGIGVRDRVSDPAAE
jgi:phospholipid-binding lipoprotein MlaA